MKKILLGMMVIGTALAVIPMFAAFEAHVVNVTARIENALNVPVKSIDFGTVFPQEKLDQTFDVSLSQSFQDESRVDDVEYFIRQKPKCWNGDEENAVFSQVTEDEQGNFHCKNPEHSLLPLLCPYLSKHELTTDGLEQENDGEGIEAFHGPISLAEWTMNVAKQYDVLGRLVKSGQDITDTWNIDLKVPCFGGHCAQDWEEFVAGINPTADPAAYVQPIEDEHKLYGCDLWLEVSGISLPGLGCRDTLDVMLVLDRSGSISDTELQSMKDAVNAFVTGLAPSVAGVHVGQTSFASLGSLDLHLTGTEADVHTAINGIDNGGNTNLSEGISLATAELENPGDGHDRDDGTSPDVMIVITDGNPNEPGTVQQAEAAANAAADAARAAGIEVFVVGIGGDVDATYLQTEIADDASHYFSADFATLSVELQKLLTCEDDETTGTVTITKVVITDDQGGDFNAGDFPLFVGAEPVVTGISEQFAPGEYMVTETGPDGFATTFSGDCDSTGKIIVAAGNSYSCTITNDDIPEENGTLTVVKVLTMDNGGNETVASWTYKVEGNVVSEGAANVLAPGAYTVTEEGPVGYTQAFSGDCDVNGEVTVVAGQSKTCTITNDDIAPTITLVKNVVNDSEGGPDLAAGDFDLRINGGVVTQSTPIAVNANEAHVITEDPEAGYAFTGFSGDAKCPDGALGGSTDPLDEGENITCTITNDDEAVVVVLAQCEDTLDNDGDGFIDFPADPACSSADDDDESPANPTTLLSDGFGTGATVNDIPSWDEQGTEGDASTQARAAGSGNDTASPNGDRFAIIGEDEWMCRSVTATGYDTLVLNYYWRGDDDAEPSDSGIVEYFTGGNCDSPTGLANLATHVLDVAPDGGEVWSSLQSVALPGSLNGTTFSVRFRTSSSNSDEYFRVDGVSVTGLPI